METIEHLFSECRVVKDFWEEFAVCLKEKCYNFAILVFNINLILFGVLKTVRTDKPLISYSFMQNYAFTSAHKEMLFHTLIYNYKI